MSWIYDAVALVGLAMMGAGLSVAFGWPIGLAASGAALVTLATLAARTR